MAKDDENNGINKKMIFAKKEEGKEKVESLTSIEAVKTSSLLKKAQAEGIIEKTSSNVALVPDLVPVIRDIVIDEEESEVWFMRIIDNDNERGMFKDRIDKIEEDLKENPKIDKNSEIRCSRYLAKVFNKVEKEIFQVHRELLKLEWELDDLEEKKSEKLKELSKREDRGLMDKTVDMLFKYAPKVIIPVISSIATLKIGKMVQFIENIVQNLQSKYSVDGNALLVGAGMFAGLLCTLAIEAFLERRKTSKIDNIFDECTVKKDKILDKENKIIEEARENVKREVKKLREVYFPEPQKSSVEKLFPALDYLKT